MVSVGRKIWQDWFVVAIVAFAGLVWAASANVFWRVDFGVYDALVARTAPPASDGIVIVAIDDESIMRLGRFPWDRNVHARMLDRLTYAGARTILYDVLFLEPGNSDEALAKSVKMAGPILPLALEIPGRNGAEVTVVEPLPILRAPNVSVGHAEILPDKDGIIRSVHMIEGVDGQQWLHVAAITACRVSRAACVGPAKVQGKGRIEEEPFLIPFSASSHFIRSVPFSTVLDGGVPDGFFKDRIVLVGATAIGLSDVHATPLSPTRALMPGVEVNANIVQALVSGRRIIPAPAWSDYVMALVPLSVLVIVFLLARPLGIFLTAFLLALLMVSTTMLLWRNGIWLSPVTGLVGIGVTYAGWSARRLQVATTFMREELRRFRRDEDDRDAFLAPATPLLASDMERLHSAISRSRDFQGFLRDILNGLPDASLVMARDGIILIQNSQAQALLGDVEGDHFSVILTLLPGEIVADRHIRPENNAFPEELTDTSGRVYNVRWSRIEGQGRNGIVAWVLRLADVTDLRHATRQREEALQLLTHDMRSPQISILTLLDQQKGNGYDEFLHRVGNYAEKTLTLADGFVQLAKAESVQLAIEDVNLADVVFDAVDDLWPQANKKNILLQTHNCDQEVIVRADRQLITRAVINIINNAIKFTFAATAVDCRIKVNGANVTISVCDRGPGIEDDGVATLFNRFQRQATDQPEGAGLGLAFVRSVAERHRGTIAYSARSGGGACFNLTLPLAGPLRISAGDR